MQQGHAQVALISSLKRLRCDAVAEVELVVPEGFDDVRPRGHHQVGLLVAGGQHLCDGGKSNDWQHGGQGDDRLYGNLGEDVIYGGRSNDWLHGGQGDDVLYGNHDADVFNLSRGSDRVMDFEANEGDRIAIQSGVNYAIQAQGSDLLINTDIGSLLLVGTEFSSFNSTQSIVQM